MREALVEAHAAAAEGENKQRRQQRDECDECQPAAAVDEQC